MEIKTTFNIGSKVFFLQENAVHYGFISNISVNISYDGYSERQSEYYDIISRESVIERKYKDVEKSLIYNSKEELLNSL